MTAQPWNPDSNWQSEGSCHDHDPELWFPKEDPDGRGGSTSYTEARKICRNCPVFQQCLDHAVNNHEGYGIWAGTTPKQRRDIRAQRIRDSHLTRSRRPLSGYAIYHRRKEIANANRSV